MSLRVFKREVAPLSMAGLFLSSVLAAVIYVFMEWLFLVTKPSFMDTLGAGSKLQVVVVASLLLAGLVALPLVIPAAVRALAGPGAVYTALARLYALVPAAVLAATLLLMLDNFTYTMFRFGIVTSSGAGRVLYLLVFLVMLAFGWKTVLGWARWLERSALRRRAWPALAALIVLAYGFSFLPERGAGMNLAAGGQRARLPNILIVTSDGVGADHMSVYGHERPTTPRMEALAPDFLFAENAFSNSGNTSGSITSLLTGKYPAETRVLYPPNILNGADAYQHLPGILKTLGYRTTQIGHPHYADALTLNFREAFDQVNGRAASASGLLGGLGRRMPYDVNYFFFETGSRILARLGHIFFIQDMKNPYDLVTEPPIDLGDPDKVRRLFELMADTSRPQFVHMHLMGTHGPTFYPREQVFSKGQPVEDQPQWDVDFYQDAVRDYDAYVGEIVDWLIQSGQYDNTILVVGSDHGQLFNHTRRIPLMIHFPQDAYAGRRVANVQNLDIAPTLLEAIGMSKPGWMNGQSLLHGEIAPRPIIGVAVRADLVSSDDRDRWHVNMARVAPPFYQFQAITVISCQRLYMLDLVTLKFDVQDVPYHSHPCAAEDTLTPPEAIQAIRDHLGGRGFDVSSLTEAKILPGNAAQGGKQTP